MTSRRDRIWAVLIGQDARVPPAPPPLYSWVGHSWPRRIWAVLTGATLPRSGERRRRGMTTTFAEYQLPSLTGTAAPTTLLTSTVTFDPQHQRAWSAVRVLAAACVHLGRLSPLDRLQIRGRGAPAAAVRWTDPSDHERRVRRQARFMLPLLGVAVGVACAVAELFVERPSSYLDVAMTLLAPLLLVGEFALLGLALWWLMSAMVWSVGRCAATRTGQRKAEKKRAAALTAIERLAELEYVAGGWTVAFITALLRQQYARLLLDFRRCDLRLADLRAIDLTGVRWDRRTQWPKAWQATVRERSVQRRPGEFVIQGWSTASADDLIPV